MGKFKPHRRKAAPDGRHRDGHWFIAMHLIGISASSGGVSRAYEAPEQAGPVFSDRLSEPGDTLIIDDRRVLHEVSPVSPAGGEGVRDMLLIDFRCPVTDREIRDVLVASSLPGRLS